MALKAIRKPQIPLLAYLCNATKAFLRREQIGFGAFPNMYLKIPELTQKTTRIPRMVGRNLEKIEEQTSNIVSPPTERRHGSTKVLGHAFLA